MRRAALVALLASYAFAALAAAPLEIRNARLVDATGAPPREGASVLVRDGRIAEIGSGALSADAAVLDAGGATLIPGLVDAHVHLAVVPGSASRGDTDATRRNLRHQHLRAYLACGVTTVLDTGIDFEALQEVREWIAAGHPAPRFLTLGTPIAARGGYMSWASQVSSPEELAAAFDLIRREGGVGVKVPIEYGFGPRKVWPIHSPEMRAAIAREAAARGLPIFVHASSEEEQMIGLEMGAHALAHLDFYDAKPSDAFLERAYRTGAYVITTFSTRDAELTRWHPERLDEPLVRLAVPEVERATARDPRAGAEAAQRVVAMMFPELPEWLQRAIAWAFVSEAASRAAVESSQRAAKRLHEAGVPLVIGSDAGNWDVISDQFHGPSTLRELELLAQAGVPPADVLAAATSTASRMLGLEREIGTVEVGKRADLVVLQGDPLRDPGAWRRVRWVVRDGVARTPAEWMAE